MTTGLGITRTAPSLSALLILLGSFSPLGGQEKSVLDKHFVFDHVRVFYSLSGPTAVRLADNDFSGVPDQVEDMAKQVWAAHRLFCGVLDFPDPLKSKRYENVTCIQVSIRNKSELADSNGKAYDSSQKARAIPEGSSKDYALVLSVANESNPILNGTPAHECFHLIQYGATYFKNGWFLEGMTRWSEHGLDKDGLGEVKYSPQGPWPQERSNLQKLVEMKYDAEFALWNPLAKKSDTIGILPEKSLDRKLVELRYSDGSPVLKDRLLTGTRIMRDILVGLDEMDDVAFKQIGYKDWSEENQRSSKNDPYIYQAIMDVLRRSSPQVGKFKAMN